MTQLFILLHQIVEKKLHSTLNPPMSMDWIKYSSPSISVLRICLGDPKMMAVIEETKGNQNNASHHHLDGFGWGSRLTKLRQMDDASLSSFKPLNRISTRESLIKCLMAVQSEAPFMTLAFVDSNFTWLGERTRVRVTFEGPPQSPYKDGIFHLSCNIPREFPLRPPEVRFLTKIYHPNIDYQVAICTSILKEEWSLILYLASL